MQWILPQKISALCSTNIAALKHLSSQPNSIPVRLDQKQEGKTPLAISLRRFGATSPVVALLRRLGARAPDADAPSSGAAALAGALGGDVRPLAPAGSMEVGGKVL